jgi:uncharacterized protein YbjT (DUF2867 family)
VSDVFVAGATGYIGRHVIPLLLQRGHSVRGLVRPGSERRLPPNCEPVVGQALDRRTFEHAVPPEGTLVHLVGVPHPNPLKAQQFFDIDLVAARASIDAAQARGADHFVYVSVAQPAPVMKAYQLSRAIAEGHLARSGLTATVLRPWYVLGPGHRWPLLVQPAYRVAEWIPTTRSTALRLGLVTIDQLAAAIVMAVDAPPKTSRILTVPDIRRVSPAAPRQ